MPLAALTEFVTEQNVESVLLEALVVRLDASGVEALCGENHHTFVLPTTVGDGVATPEHPR
jgi:hypothetical protein